MGSNAAYALETLVTLAGILVLAVVVLLGARRLGIGRSTGPVALLGRLTLDARKSVYVVRIANKTYALLASESGLSKLDEFDESEFPAPEPNAHTPAGLLELWGLRKKGRDHVK